MNKFFIQFKNEDWIATIVGWVITSLIVLFPEWIPKVPQNPDAPQAGYALLGLFLFALFFSAAGVKLLGVGLRGYAVSFVVLFAIAATAQYVSRIEIMKTWGLESVFFSVAIGLLIRNTVGLPRWIAPAVRSEYFIKIGLVLLGTSVLFSEMMKAGLWGILQSVVVVFSVWYFTFWLARKLKVDEEMGVMLASAVSICGVSAAIAACGAIKGDSRKLSFVVSLVLVVAVPMMYLMPWIARLLGLSQEVAGAWLGGTIDTTGAVVASGKFVGDVAETYSVIIKSSQNVLLGVAAFLLSIYWSIRGTNRVERPTPRVLWDRFPKFVVGFVLASLVFSFCLDAEKAQSLGKLAKGMREVMFSLGFVCIGLETDFRTLLGRENRKYISTFLVAQSFNIVVTLVMALMLFGWLAA